MKNKFIIALLAISSLLNSNCTDLEEQVLDESLTGSGQSEAVSGAIAPAYGLLPQTFRHTRYFGLQLIPSDEAILPARGGDQWYDGGRFLELHTHNITPSNGLVGDAWNYMTTNISRTVIAIEVLTPLAETNTEAQAALYEMKALRAYLNMLMLDSWGLAFKKESSEDMSEILRGQEAIDYIESEFLSVADVINKDEGPGRMTQAAVWGFLAKLHLNAAVYRDPYGTPSFSTEDMDKVIEYTDNIINSGNFTLSPEYFDLFNDDNHDNQELIFALDQRGILNNDHSRWAYWSLSGSLFPRPEYPNADGTDGPSITPDFYQTWVDAYGNTDPADADARFYQKNVNVPSEYEDLDGFTPQNDEDRYICVAAEDFEIDRGIMRGTPWAPRKDPDGNFYTCNGGYRIYAVGERREANMEYYVNHTLDVDFTANNGYASGYRVSKYQFSHTSPNGNNYSSVDLVLLRYAEIYLMRAEAKLRKGDNAGALSDVNFVRTSRTARAPIPSALNSIDLDILYRERGFELYWEMARRTDMIRFGHYEDTWTEKTDTDVRHRLFPIPQSAIDGSSNTPGYLEQNPGY
ncbi:RagB/SusD family nutrient uptake outer membrane protein [Sinomicrobium pectinilyticum]|uniref:RagB/SusD family nutrient uptake outer membrane protein n=1 Tax=Sinomicrobium pectinilyticum TaxID=1084421 RepID=A0A3N0E3A1_SINP1|nr:RagB/SusD family nutrient uptake outer membrane protein [Sinomicrobium pectinilyticum]RNL82273.1 RagB/SusD family nutrient uptake outer membrane protein [Sinomicrobium pectinilyticum]